MKKIILLAVIAITFYSCNKEFNEVVEATSTNYQVHTMNNNPNYIYSDVDTVLVVYIGFNSVESISEVSINAYSSDGKSISGTDRKLLDDGDVLNSGDVTKGDRIYSTKLKMNSSMPNGKYKIEYSVIDNMNSKKIAGTYSFTFNNGQANIPPVISNDYVEPDTVVANDTIPILVRMNVEDANGLTDIEKVYFVSYRPNGTTSGTEFNLRDDGDSTNGDLTANDGIYSLVIAVNQTSTKGLWRFEFKAKDRGNKYSNIINHNVLIK